MAGDFSNAMLTNIVRYLAVSERCIEVATVYLSFVQNKRSYRCLCRSCHRHCTRLCAYVAKKKVGTRIGKLQEQDQMATEKEP